MADLVVITDPATGQTYRVHPFVAENGEWFGCDRTSLRALLPGIAAFERDLARLTTNNKQDNGYSTSVLESGVQHAS